MGYCCCFMAQQIPIGTSGKKLFIAFPTAFPYGKGDGAVGMIFSNGRYQMAQTIIVIPHILAALEHKCAKSQGITSTARLQNFFFRQTVSLRLSVAFADTAIIAIIFADVGNFHQSTDIDFFAKNLLTKFLGFFLHIRRHFLPMFQKIEQFFFRKIVFRDQFFG